MISFDNATGNVQVPDDPIKLRYAADSSFQYASAFSPAIVFANVTVNKRAVFLGLLVTISIGLCLGTGALYIAGKLVNVNGNPGPGAAVEQGGDYGVAEGLKLGQCFSKHCLEEGAYMYKIMDYSVDPCQDFYSYACGNWPNVHSVDPDAGYTSVLRQLREKNLDLLRRIIETPSKRQTEWSYERKVKDFFKSCIDKYGRMLTAGDPFIEQIIKPIGGAYIFGTFDNETWDMTDQLKKVHVDFWTDILFSVDIGVDWRNRHQQVILIRPEGSLNKLFYTDVHQQNVLDDYKTYMKTVARLLIRDSGIPMNDTEIDERVDIFVSDVIEFETEISRLLKGSPNVKNAYANWNRMTIQQLDTLSNNVINFTAVLSDMFNTAGVRSSTKVVVFNKIYIRRLANYISNLGSDGKRMVHNYFLWRLAIAYTDHLSWDYIHAGQKFYIDSTGSTELRTAWQTCFGYASHRLDVALSAIFLGVHFEETKKIKLTDIIESMSQAALEIIEAIPWMDDETKIISKQKIEGILYQIGYPDYMADQDEIDTIHYPLKISRTDYFQNMLNINVFKRAEWNTYLRFGEHRGQWKGTTFSPYLIYYLYWNEIIAPAGILQFPLYAHDLPHYVNFGKLGTFLGHMMIHALDGIGRYFLPNGHYQYVDGRLTSWWSEETGQNFTQAEKCILDDMNSNTAGPFIVDGKRETVKINHTSAMWTIAELGGLKIGYKALKKWEQEHGEEPRLPSLNLTNDQVVFIAGTQIWCINRRDISAYNRVKGGGVTTNFIINTVMSNDHDFADVFKCKPPAPMVKNKTCPVF